MRGLVGILAGGLLAIVVLLLGPAPTAHAATVTVTTTLDEDGPGGTSACSLREAIHSLNNGGDVGGCTASGIYGTDDTINFGLFFSFLHAPCPKTINVGSDPHASGLPLPKISKKVTIDGYSQPGSHPNTQAVGSDAAPCIVLDGTSVTAGGNGLTINAANVTVKGLVVHNFKNGFGISVEAGGSGANIQGNFVGTDAAGNGASPNDDAIVVVDAPNITIGGTTPADRNLISGNTGHLGILANGPTLTGLKIQGNYIGTNAAGTSALANGAGLLIVGGVPSPTIGGTAVGAGNVISGNTREGIAMGDAANDGGPTGAIVQGNVIGMNAAGTAAVANGLGIDVIDGTTSATIGGGGPGASNLIAFNTGAGVSVERASSGVDVRGNAIFSNGGLGIDLGNDGVTPNDSGDGDTGPNDLQNFPVITSAIAAGGTTTIRGTLNTTPSSGPYQIDLYSNTACDPTGFGEGETFLGTVSTGVTNVHGNIGFSFTFSSALPIGRAITATATSPGGSTSELSSCAAVNGPPGFTVTPTNGLVTTENGGRATFTVVLTSIPTATVSIGLSTSDPTEGTVSPGVLQFTPGNALTPQTVTVTGVSDSVIDGDVAYTIVTSPAASSDPAYNGLDPPDVAVLNKDTACGPNPNIRLSTAPQTPGHLRVTVTGVTSAQLPSNPLQRIVFGVLGNARVEVGGQPIDPSQPLVLPPDTASTTFTVVRVAGGQAATVPFTVTDTCGAWRTFVGGGPNAF